MLPSVHRLGTVGAPSRDLYFYEEAPRKKPVRPIDDGLGDDDGVYIARNEKNKNPSRAADVEVEPGWCWLCCLVCCSESWC